MKYVALIIVLVVGIAAFSGCTETEKQYSINVTTLPVGSGTITFSPPGGIYTSGTTVTLTANPKSGYRFDAWTGSVSSTSTSLVIVLNKDIELQANFIEILSPTSEDLTTYSVTDPEGYLMVSSSTVSSSLLPATKIASLYKNQVFNVDFVVTFNATVESMTEPEELDYTLIHGVVSLSSSLRDTARELEYSQGLPGNQSISVVFKTWRSPTSQKLYRVIELRDNRFQQSSVQWINYMQMQYNTKYTISIHRTSGVLGMDIYSDGNLVYSDALTMVNNVQFNYFYPYLNYGATSANYGTFTFSFDDYKIS